MTDDDTGRDDPALVVTGPARALAPDLARGLLLLPVALVHAPAHLHGRDLDDVGLTADPSVVDRWVTGVRTVTMDQRVYPAFALLLGYGLVRLRDRLVAEGRTSRAVRRLLRRRGVVLLLFGAVHALTAWSGDILGAYGLLTVLIAGALDLGEIHALSAAALSVLVVAVGGGLGLDEQLTSVAAGSITRAAAARFAEWWPSLVLQPLGLLGAVLLGVVAARRGVLDDPARHRSLLIRAASYGLAAAGLGGLPQAMLRAGLVPVRSPARRALVGALHAATGYGGIGYVAAVALLDGRPAGSLRTGVATCGQRSLSSYLAQSVVLGPLLDAWGLGRGRRVGVGAVSVLAAATWAGTVAAAHAGRRRRGPAERLLRLLVGPTPRTP